MNPIFEISAAPHLPYALRGEFPYLSADDDEDQYEQSAFELLAADDNHDLYMIGAEQR